MIRAAIIHLPKSVNEAQRIGRALENTDIDVHIMGMADWNDLKKLDAIDADVVIAHVDLEDREGLLAIRKARKALGGMPFLIVTDATGPARTVDLIVGGASGCVLMDSLERLPRAVHDAMHEARQVIARRNAEQTVIESQERYRAFIENSSEAIWRWQLDKPMPITLSEDEQIDWAYRHARLAECNVAMARMYGFDSPAQMIGMRLDTITPRDNPRNIEMLRQFIRSGYRLVDVESEDVDAQGRTLFALNNMHATIVDGLLTHGWGTNRDITARKLAERAAQLSEERARIQLAELEVLYRDTPVGLALMDRQLRFARINQRLASINGAPVERHLGRTVREVVPALAETVEPVLRRVLESGQPLENVEMSGYAPDDPTELRHWLASFRPVFDAARQPVGVMVVVQDITERKRSEDQVRASEARFSAILQSSLDALITMDDFGRIVDFNPAAERIFGYRREEVVGKTVADTLIPHRLREVHERGLDNYLRTNTGPMIGQRIELPALRRDGVEIPVELALAATRLPGKPPFFTAFLRDISDRLRGEDELRRSEEQYRSLVAQVKDYAIFMIDAEGTIKSWNQGVLRVLGYSQKDFIGRNARMLFTPEDIEVGVPETELRIAADTGRASDDRWVMRSDGARIWVSGTTSAARDSAGQLIGFTKVMRDLTLDKVAEDELARHKDRLEHLVHDRTVALQATHERLRLAERMAALGTLSAGLGHDMGNLLLPIRSRLDLIQSKDPSGTFEDDVAAIRTATEYMARLVRGLRLLAMDPSDETASGEVTDVKQWWGGAESMLRNALPRGVELKLELPDDLPPMALAPHLLMQIVFNLVQNAGDAMQSRGHGTVTIFAEHLPDRERVRIGVVDDGPGMSPETVRRCIEPFFTTKARGLSTGLGLSLVHGIIRKAGGSLEIHSEPGEGARFEFTIASMGSAPTEGHETVRPLAALSIQDSRIRSYIDSVLTALNIEVSAKNDAPSPETRLWVTDAGERITETVREFIEADGRRRAVIIGTVAQQPDHSAIITLAGEPKPGQIRQTLRDVAREMLESGDGDSHSQRDTENRSNR